MAVTTSLGPLKDNADIAVIGGGPGGCSVALTLVRLADEQGKRFRIRLFEPKSFGVHYNQCLGVLSPPLQEILSGELGITIPKDMIHRRLSGYVLHGGDESILLEEGEEETVAVRRVDFDAFMLDAVRRAGVEVIRSRVTAIELRSEKVIVFSEGEHLRADVAFGCFGLDPVLGEELQRDTMYIPPRRTEALVTKYDCSPGLLDRFGNHVQAYLPRIEGVEFAAITPKLKHASVVLVGKRVKLNMIETFLEFPEVRQFLPPNYSLEEVYKGTFPRSPAQNFFEDRFVAVGDAAGLMRPFKGKGINSAIITGALAARTAVINGISKHAFRNYQRQCAFLINDYPYGRFMRGVTNFISHQLSLGPVIRFAKKNDVFRWALTKSVSGGAEFREIVRRCFRPGVAFGLLGNFVTWPFRRKRKQETG